MPRVSVILPTRDRADLLPRAIGSVMAQTERDFELILVDNNQAERPVAEATEAAWRRDPRVRIVRTSNAATAAAARNVGLEVAAGEFVTFLDDDDAYRPTKLQRQLELVRSAGAPLVLCGAVYHLAGRQRLVQCDAPDWQKDDLLVRARWGTPFLLHRASAVRFDETLNVAEDAEFALRLVAVWGGDRVPVVAEPLVDVYPQSGLRVNATGIGRRRAAARILAQHRCRFSRQARRRFVLQTLVAIAKLARERDLCARLSWKLLCESRGADWRACANACAVGLGIAPRRWVS